MSRRDLRPRPTARLATRLAVAALGLGVLSVGLAGPASADRVAPAPEPPTPATRSDISLVQANIYTGLPVPKFQADVRKVLALGTDFITYNEAHSRVDEVMAPEGYDIWRDMTDRYTKETPVVWRTDRWTAIAKGSWMISDHRGVPPGKQVELGRRWANWVTLAGVDGRQVSVVSVHIAPSTKGMPDLLRPSVKRLGMLVDRLAPRGAVFVGGDFNIHYPGAKYPRDLLEAARLIPTYDALGSYFPTGDHYGATIDYVMGRGNGQLDTIEQYPVELHSDHDAVLGGYNWLTDVPADVREVVSDPAGTTSEKRAAVGLLASAVRRAQPGSAVRIATAQLDSAQLARDLRVALTRGVHVQLVKIGGGQTRRERRLENLIAADGDPSSWTVRCVKECRATWRGFTLGALMMVGDSSGAWTARYSVNRQLTGKLLTAPTKITVNVGPYGLAEGQRIFGLIT